MPTNSGNARLRRESAPDIPGSVRFEPRTPAIGIGALRQWNAELQARVRSRVTFDALWRAACREAEALDLSRLGCLGASRQAADDAARIVVIAARARRSSTGRHP